MSDPNPAIYTLAPDETLWMFKGGISDLQSLLEGPDEWVKTHVKACSSPPSGVYIVEFSSQSGEGDMDLSFFGTCGTSVIYVTGHEHVFQLLSGPRALVAPNDFWTGLDDRLEAATGASGIEVFVMPSSGRVFVHYESGTDRLFHAEMMCAATLDQPGYLKWLKGEVDGVKLPRICHRKEPEDQSSVLSMDEVVFQPRGTHERNVRDIRMLYQSLSPGGSKGQIREKACNGTHGRIVGRQGGKYVCEPDFMFTKPYPLR
ncbi:MAG: hypothetical protein JST30_16890 [Armatimonadetes bacterium]|nr:hypothetical protein [Armatimonadota bacterium]